MKTSVITTETKKLTLHSALAHMTYNLSALAIKTFFYLLSTAFEEIEEAPAIYCVESKGYKKYVGTRNMIHLKKVFRELRRAEVTINITGKFKGTEYDNIPWETALMGGAGHVGNNIFFEVPIGIRQLAINYREMFVYLNLAIIADFQSKNSLALYVSLRDYARKGKVKIMKNYTIEQLHTLFDSSEKHKESFKIFHRDVLKKSVVDINKLGDIGIHYETIKVKRRVVGVKFFITMKSKATSSIFTETNSEFLIKKDSKMILFLETMLNQDLQNRIAATGFAFTDASRDRLTKLMQPPYSYDLTKMSDYIRFLCEEAEKQEKINIATGNNKSIGGLFSSFILKDRRLNVFEQSIESKNKAKSKKKENDVFDGYVKFTVEAIKGHISDKRGEHFKEWLFNNWDLMQPIVEKIVSTDMICRNIITREKVNLKIADEVIGQRSLFIKIFSTHEQNFEYAPLNIQPSDKSIRKEMSEIFKAVERKASMDTGSKSIYLKKMLSAYSHDELQEIWDSAVKIISSPTG